MKAKSSSNTESILSTPGFRDCWPFLTAFEIYWNTYDSGEKHVPVNESYGVDVNQEQAYPSGRGILLAPKIGPVGWCWKVIWLPSAFVTDVVLLPVECVVTGCLIIGLLEELSHGQ